jgi:excinuclease ABC subunit B
LREGLDIPECQLVVILDADKEGYLRSRTALIQTMGRAARHVDGQVLLYADKMTPSLIQALQETERRRALQNEYNIQHGITPRSVKAPIAKGHTPENAPLTAPDTGALSLEEMYQAMITAAENLEFEKAEVLKKALLARGYKGFAEPS